MTGLSVAQQVISSFHHGTYSISQLDKSDIEEVKAVLASHNYPLSYENLTTILNDMQNEDPQSFYIVIKDNNSRKLVGLGYLWFERKYTRRICTLLHIGELFTALSLSPAETAEAEFLLVECLSDIGLKMKNCYKSTLHVSPDRSPRYKQLHYEQSEVHMSLYQCIKPTQNL